jgi:hypothetical protein
VDLKFLRVCRKLRIGTSNPKTTLGSKDLLVSL